MGQEFEPDNVNLLALLCDNDSRVLDVGANIGMTALALSQICPRGQIAAIEPVPRTFQYLRRNVAEADSGNIKIFNFALGSREGLALMQGHPAITHVHLLPITTKYRTAIIFPAKLR